MTPRQLQTTTPHPLVTMDRCLGPYNPKIPSNSNGALEC